jgi:hypothetical protein
MKRQVAEYLGRIKAGAVSFSMTKNFDTGPLDGNAVVHFRIGRVTSGYAEQTVPDGRPLVPNGATVPNPVPLYAAGAGKGFDDAEAQETILVEGVQRRLRDKIGADAPSPRLQAGLLSVSGRKSLSQEDTLIDQALFCGARAAPRAGLT